MTLTRLFPERLLSQISLQASPASQPRVTTKAERGAAARTRGYALENQALEWIQRVQPSWRLLAQNYRGPGRWPGEIDLIFEASLRSGSLLIFIEVRARLNPRESGLESVGWKKRRQVERVAAAFMREQRGTCSGGPGQGGGIRFDVMSFDGAAWTHVPGAW